MREMNRRSFIGIALAGFIARARRLAAELARLPERPSEAPQADAGQADGSAQDIVLDYCAAVRGILNDDQGGPLNL